MKKQARVLFPVFFILLLSALPALAAPEQPAAGQPAPAQKAQARIKYAVSPNEMKLRSSLRGLLIQCLNKQRTVAVKTLTSAQDLPAAQDNLTTILNSIGGVFKTYYGDTTGGQITALFSQYIQLTANYADAVKNGGDTSAVISSMKSKAGGIERFFISSSPVWAKSRLSEALNKYSDFSVKEIDMESKSLGKPDTKVFGATFKQNAVLCDILSTGIAKQFPDQFKNPK